MDVWLSATNEAAMVTALTDLSQYSGGDFVYGDGGSWSLEVKGQIVSPLPQVTVLPSEPGNFTDRTGLPIEPEVAMTQDQKVGVEDPTYGASNPSAFWVLLHWNSSQPLPNYVAHGLTVTTSGPYKSHY